MATSREKSVCKPANTLKRPRDETNQEEHGLSRLNSTSPLKRIRTSTTDSDRPAGQIFGDQPDTNNNVQNDMHETQQHSAVTRALGTQELLEMILLRLPICHLLARAPLVCKHWQAIISDSTKCQQATFFQPLPYEPLRLLESRTHTALQWRRSQDDQYVYTVFKNPFLDLHITAGEPIARPEASWRHMIRLILSTDAK